MSAYKTQCQKVLDWIEQHGSITPLDAIQFGCFRLGARVYDLKKMGYPIKKEIRTIKKADGTGTYIAVYSIKEE